MIKIVAKMLVKADKVEEFKATAKELVEKSSAEEGNVFYTLNVSTADPRLLAFIECWKDKEALAVHESTEHFKNTLPKLAALCEQGQPADLFTQVEY